MKRRTRTCLVVATALVLGSSLRAHTDRSSIFRLLAEDAENRQFLSETIFAGYSDDAEASYAELPTLGPERGFWIGAFEHDALLVWSEASTNLVRWAGRKRVEARAADPAAVVTRAELGRLAAAENLGRFWERKISPDLARRICGTWQRILRAEQQPLQQRGLDGVEVIFGSNWNGSGPYFWRLSNPRPGTPAAELMRLAEALRVVAVSGNTSSVEKILADLSDESLQPLPTPKSARSENAAATK